MAIYHLNVRGIAPAKGSSALKCAAYQSGQCLERELTGERVQYARAERVQEVGIVLPPDASEWARDRAALWNAAEAAFAGGNACIAHRYEVALPRELDASEMRELVVGYCQHFADKGRAVDWAIHMDAGNVNPHAHILVSDRTIDENGFDCSIAKTPKTVKAYLCEREGERQTVLSTEWKEAHKLGWEKVYNYRDADGERIRLTKEAAAERGLTNEHRIGRNAVAVSLSREQDETPAFSLAKEQLKAERAAWAEAANERLRAHAVRCNQEVQRIDERSHADRGLEEVPQIHLGQNPTPERIQEYMLREQVNRAIRQSRDLIEAAQGRIKQKVEQAVERVKQWYERRADPVQQLREAHLLRQHSRALAYAGQTVERATTQEFRRELSQTVKQTFERVHESVPQALEALQCACSKRGIEVEPTKDKNGMATLAFSYKGKIQNVNANAVLEQARQSVERVSNKDLIKEIDRQVERSRAQRQPEPEVRYNYTAVRSISHDIERGQEIGR